MYRIWQFWKAITARLTPPDWSEVERVLTPGQLVLFKKMTLSDRAHSCRVMQTLLEKGFEDRQLMAAALLHDSGKSQHPLRFWERPIPVLMRYFKGGDQESVGDQPQKGWRRALVIARQHPEWGAVLAEDAGASPLTVWLIRNHQQAQPAQHPHPRALEYLKALQEADNQS